MSQTKVIWMAAIAGASIVLALVNGANAVSDILENNRQDDEKNNKK